jgi:hypothetical protein
MTKKLTFEGPQNRTGITELPRKSIHIEIIPTNKENGFAE